MQERRKEERMSMGGVLCQSKISPEAEFCTWPELPGSSTSAVLSCRLGAVQGKDGLYMSTAVDPAV